VSLASFESLQFMTLLSDGAVTFVVAFLAAAVALNTGLIVCPFVRLGSWWSFSWTLVVGTWLAFRGVDLHLLQTVVVVFPGRNIPLDLGVRSALIDSFLLHLSFVEAFVDLHREIVHSFRRGRAFPASDFILNLLLQSSIELRRDRFVVPAGLDYQGLELGFVLRYWSALLDGLESAFRFHLFVAVSKRGLQFIKECRWSSHDNSCSCLQVVELGMLQEIFQVGKNPLVCGSAQVRGKKQELLAIGIELVRVQGEVRQALELERLDLVSLSGEFGQSVHSERSSSSVRTRR